LQQTLPAPAPPTGTSTLTVALLGNPNTGKTTLFNALSGLRQRVGNYPGVTVERKVGRASLEGRAFDVIDLPGTYSLAPRSPDEMVAVDVILGCQPGESRPDVIVSIVDASNLERNLYLTTQLLDVGVPVVIALNMVDVARDQGREHDVARLQERLGVPVVPIQANRGQGLKELKQAILHAAHGKPPSQRPKFPEAFDQEVGSLEERLKSVLNGDSKTDAAGALNPFLLRRTLLDIGGFTEQRLVERFGRELGGSVVAARQRLAAAGCPVPAIEPRTRYAWIKERLQGCVRDLGRPTASWTDRLDRVLTHRIWGTLIFLLVMFLVFQSIFTGATPLMDFIGSGQEWLAGVVSDALAPGPLRSLIVGGVIEGVGGVLVFLPQIVILFGIIAILEDCGYMARAAFLMDKIMARCGLSGKSFIPLLSSFACAIPGIMAARVIEDRRDRLTTILVAPLMSCSARLPVYVLLTAAFIPTDTVLGWALPGLVLFSMYLIGLVVAPLVALVLKRTLLRGQTPLFLMELPPYKWPSLSTVLHRMYDRGKAFVVRAGTLILATMIVVWALLYFPSTGTDEQGQSINYDLATAELEEELAAAQEKLEPLEALPETERTPEQLREIEALAAEADSKAEALNHLKGIWTRNSWLGRMGRAIEPLVEPLGWDWRVGMAALASFPAREVVVGTLGVIYDAGPDQDESSDTLKAQLRAARWDAGSARAGQPVFTIPVALSLMVFFALCCQCASTLAIMRRETNSWRWPIFTFVYMTGLAYLAALATYQLGSLLL
jgi:ferrous iron transport protein B